MSERGSISPGLEAGFTLVEMLTALAISAIIGAGILMAMVGLQKTFQATEQYAISQAGQARLLAYVARDLRALSGTSGIYFLSGTTGTHMPIVSGSFTPIGSGTATSNTLIFVVPRYYVNATDDSTNPIVYVSGSTSASGAMGYGPSSAIATGTVQYFKAFQSFFGSQCYLRVESEGATSGTTTIVEKADGMLLELICSGTQSASTPASYTARVRFAPSFKSSHPKIREPAPNAAPNNGTEVTATDWVLLRGTN